MTKDDIIRLADDAGAQLRFFAEGSPFIAAQLARFAELVAADAERKLGALLDDCEKHVDELQTANEKLGQREDWWNEKLFQAQERIKADIALLRQALGSIQTFREWEMGQDYNSNRDTVLAKAFEAEEALIKRLEGEQ